MYKAGKVFVQNKFAGIIKETDSGYIFTYDTQYLNESDAIPVSLTMPLQEEPYTSNVLFPFFDGLIPEGWLLNLVEKNWKIDSYDRFSLLLVTCRDCIGDVRIEVA
ncbi:MAG: HipA N-terminal domain-containing protein [Lachnospiraceae bacterium]|nr:HipA N-terminal domain-containing protein [Lachnospiraceae bacterium]